MFIGYSMLRVSDVNGKQLLVLPEDIFLILHSKSLMLGIWLIHFSSTFDPLKDGDVIYVWPPKPSSLYVLNTTSLPCIV